MKRAVLICALLLAGLVMAPPASAAPSDVSEAAKICRDGYASYGFRNVGACVAYVARGGQLQAPGPAQLTLIFEASPCYTGITPTYGCMWSVEGSGLKPGSVVIVGGAEVSYGSPIPVGPSGTVSAHGIYLVGDCVIAGFENPDFIARGVAADGSPVESEVVTGDYLQLMSLCV